jgi:hypothetical protein
MSELKPNHGVCIGGPYAGRRMAATGETFHVVASPPLLRLTVCQEEVSSEKVPTSTFTYHAGIVQDRSGEVYPVWALEGIDPIAELLAHYQRTARG